VKRGAVTTATAAPAPAGWGWGGGSQLLVTFTGWTSGFDSGALSVAVLSDPSDPISVVTGSIDVSVQPAGGVSLTVHWLGCFAQTRTLCVPPFSGRSGLS
jgi:hypothetical protein